MDVGDRVRHGVYGPGVVLGLRFGRRVKVRFEKAPTLPRTVFRKELEPLYDSAVPSRAAPARFRPAPVLPREEEAAPRPAPEGGPPSPNGSARPKQKSRAKELPAEPVRPAEPALPEEICDLRQTLEALRLGVVPARFVKEYTVGRAQEIASLERLLDRKSGFRVLWGDYGAGKTHLLDVVERIALDRGFVTARVVLDPIEVSPTHPKRVYDAVVSSLSYPDGSRGLEPLMRRLVDSPGHRNPDGGAFSPFFSPYLFALDHGAENLIAWVRDYVYGAPMNGSGIGEVLSAYGWRGRRPLALSDFRTYGRMYTHMIGTLAVWARDAGFEGLVLLLDEVEGMDQYRSELAGYARQVLMHYAAATVPRHHLSFDPESHAELYRGGHPVHRKIGLKYRPDQPLGVLLAMTPLPDLEQVFARIVATRDYDVRLEALSRAEMRSLTDRIPSLYYRAHPDFVLPASGPDRLAAMLDTVLESTAGTPRDVVRSTVLLLDEMRLIRQSA